MNAWRGQWRKEFRQQRWSMVAWIVIEVVILFAIYNLSQRLGGELQVLLIIPFAFVMMFHALLFPIYLFDSLHKEKKRLDLWLHNPQSGYRLLFVKMMHVFVFLLVSLAIGYIGFVYPFHDVLAHFEVHIARPEFAHYGMKLFLGLGSASIFLGVWMMFFWVLYQVLVTRIGKWAVALNILLFLVITSALEWLGKTALFSGLTEWGGVSVWPSSVEFMIDSTNIQVDVGSMDMMYLGNYIFWFVILVILFFLSGWLIDKKVEV